MINLNILNNYLFCDRFRWHQNSEKELKRKQVEISTQFETGGQQRTGQVTGTRQPLLRCLLPERRATKAQPQTEGRQRLPNASLAQSWASRRHEAETRASRDEAEAAKAEEPRIRESREEGKHERERARERGGREREDILLLINLLVIFVVAWPLPHSNAPGHVGGEATLCGPWMFDPL
jgi:hypothetical protein